MADYTGLYVYDVYDAVQGGDPSLPAAPFNLDGGNILGEGSLNYKRCEFNIFGEGGKTLRYTLTRKADGKTLSGLTKLATMGSYGDTVGIAINGATPVLNIGPGNVPHEITTTELTEIAITLSGYGDPIAFWLPGATLESAEPPPVQRRWQDWQGVVEEVGPFT